MEKKVQEIENAIKAAQDSATEALELKNTIEANKTEMEQKFDNVDATLAELKKQMEEKKEMKEQTLEMAFKEVLESKEFKNNMEALKKGQIVKFTQEIKVDTSAVTGDVNRTVQNTTVYGPSFAKLSFLNRLPHYPIPEGKNRILYPNASFVDNTDYVGEGAAVATGNSGTLVEKYREIAKVGNKLEFTSETASDIPYFLNWLKNQSRTAVYAKVDSFIWNGDGADGTKPKHVYGIKNAATAFDATKAGLAGKLPNADLKSLLLAMQAQIEKETNEAYTPNTVYMSTEGLVQFTELRDANGNQLNFPAFEKAINCEILSTTKLKGDEILMLDINAVQLHEKLGFELEVERVASTDSYVMYLRWRGNVAIPDELQKAVVYAASAETAINALKA